ncbi:MMPL family transporter [Aeromicrobium wangtongii]|uniref:MMPL family transporter n=1 Tax=Aeromicrobium wangtongii TaxID=2969247 RepID=A0ABY5M5T4_9ACTN|nr:MMPL family transporter [Aeromicrobium wangtongii]MCD9199902.1 MMPL family transporter [Aeromicrobium wangtongii]UUP13519.1 MMPL family transporter [Aeromicrobium wangtongii]
MAWHLYRLGRWSFRHRRIVISFWIGLLLLMGVGASTLSGKTSDQFTLPGIESIEAFDLMKERTPDAAPDGATARIVFQAPEGEKLTDPENAAAVKEALAAVDSKNVMTPPEARVLAATSEDGRTGYASIQYAKQSIELTDADREALETAPEVAQDAGLTVAIGGDALQEIPAQGLTELIGVGLAVIVLLITFGSLLMAGMPLLTAIIGVGIGVAGITTLTGFIDLGSSTPTLALMLGLAVGIDYALFIASRYRHEIHVGRSQEEAAGRAVGTAGSAVVFAGLTVVIALAGLSIVNINFLTQMGLAASATVAVAVLIALTLLPALFGAAGGKIGWGKIPFIKAPDPEDETVKNTMGRRWADLITKHRIKTLVGGLVVAGVVAIPVASMQLALPDDGTAPDGTGPRVAYDLIADNFGAGTNGPLLVVVDTKGADDPEAAVSATVKKVESVKKDVAAVLSPVPAKDAAPAEAEAFEGQLEATDYAIITLVPKSGPSDADTQTLVEDLRDEVSGVEADTGATVYVTGQTAVGVDISEKLADAFPKYLVVVVGLAFILLLIVFRSILVPLKAVAGFLLSVGVSLGATVAVFQWGWFADLIGVDKSGPVLFMLPLLLTGILFGLAMDYEVFLVSRMREEFVHGRPAKESVVFGFQYGARVVTAAAAIMVGVFGSFALGDEVIIKSIGFGLAVGVLADAFLVRMTIVPAFMALMGDRMWWLPKWLDKAMPNLDIEGESLVRRVEERDAAERETVPVA